MINLYKSKRGLGIIIVLGIIAVVIVAGLIGYFVWKNSATQAITTTAIPTVTPPPSSSASTTWETFSDAATGMTVSFPRFASVETISSTPETTSSAATVQLNVLDPINNQTVISPVTFAIQTNPQNLSLQNWFEQNVDYKNLLTNAGDVKMQTLSSGIALLTLNGPFPQQYLDYIGGGPISDMFAMTSDGNYVIIPIISDDPAIADITSPDSLDAMMPSILNTIRFNQPTADSVTSTVDTSGWQTYANQQYGFSFEYPSGWVVTSSVLGPSTNGITLDSSTTDATITFDQNPNNLSAQEYYNGQNEPSLFGDQNAYESTTTVGGLLAYASTPYASEAGESYLIVPRDGYFIDVMVLTSDPVFDQIISTFQFTQ